MFQLSLSIKRKDSLGTLITTRAFADFVGKCPCWLILQILYSTISAYFLNSSATLTPIGLPISSSRDSSLWLCFPVHNIAWLHHSVPCSTTACYVTTAKVLRSVALSLSISLFNYYLPYSDANKYYCFIHHSKVKQQLFYTHSKGYGCKYTLFLRNNQEKTTLFQ